MGRGEPSGHQRVRRELLVSVQFYYGKWPIPLERCKVRDLASIDMTNCSYLTLTKIEWGKDKFVIMTIIIIS